MTPVFDQPSHVNRDGWEYSNVFHANEPGLVVAKFIGPNHETDAKEFCERYGVQGTPLSECRKAAKGE